MKTSFKHIQLVNLCFSACHEIVLTLLAWRNIRTSPKSKLILTLYRRSADCFI